MFEGFVSTLTCFYHLDEPCVIIRFSGDNDPAVFFLVVHQSLRYRDPDTVEAIADLYEFLGDESSPQFAVEDKDVLVVLAKRQDMVVASQVFEVNVAASETGAVLIPRGGYNLLCDQNDVTMEEAVTPVPTIPVMLPWYA